MKIQVEDIKMGYMFLAFDFEDRKWYRTLVTQVDGKFLTLADIDPLSPFMGMEWLANIEELQDVNEYKAL